MAAELYKKSYPSTFRSKKFINQIIQHFHNLHPAPENLMTLPPAALRLAVFIQHQLLVDKTHLLRILFSLASLSQVPQNILRKNEIYQTRQKIKKKRKKERDKREKQTHQPPTSPKPLQPTHPIFHRTLCPPAPPHLSFPNHRDEPNRRLQKSMVFIHDLLTIFP